jgi:hypothetical protein
VLSDDRPEARDALARLGVRHGDVGELARQTLATSGIVIDDEATRLAQD